MPIHGLIFDFGGIITNMRWDVAHALEEQHGLERNTLARTYFASEEWREVEVGRGDTAEWQRAAHRRLEEAAGHPLPRLHEKWRASTNLIQENVDLIRSLRPPYRIGVLSNADVSLEERIRDGMGIHHLFDDVVCSAIVGMAKPDHRIYLLAAERLGVAPAECVFIDDAERNVKAGREVGMTAVHYRIDRGDNLAQQLAELAVRPAAGT